MNVPRLLKGSPNRRKIRSIEEVSLAISSMISAACPSPTDLWYLIPIKSIGLPTKSGSMEAPRASPRTRAFETALAERSLRTTSLADLDFQNNLRGTLPSSVFSRFLGPRRGSEPRNHSPADLFSSFSPRESLHRNVVSIPFSDTSRSVSSLFSTPSRSSSSSLGLCSPPSVGRRLAVARVLG